MPRIPFRTGGFTSARIPLQGALPIGVARLAWAAATIGKTPFSPPVPSRDAAFEMAWRAAMVRANLSVVSPHYTRSVAYDRLDRSEKAAVSFFLAQVQAKSFAEAFFQVDVFAHVDVVLDIVGRGRRRSRPDFVGYDRQGALAIAVEAKGRANGYTAELRRRAKAQAQRLPAIVGVPTTAYAHIAFCEGDGTWCALLEDPPRVRTQRDLSQGEVALGYYLPIVEAIADGARRGDAREDNGKWVIDLADVGLQVMVPTRIVAALRGIERDERGRVIARDAAVERASSIVGEYISSRATRFQALPDDNGARIPAHLHDHPADEDDRVFAGGDGITVVLDDTWLPWTSQYVNG